MVVSGLCGRRQHQAVQQCTRCQQQPDRHHDAALASPTRLPVVCQTVQIKFINQPSPPCSSPHMAVLLSLGVWHTMPEQKLAASVMSNHMPSAASQPSSSHSQKTAAAEAAATSGARQWLSCVLDYALPFQTFCWLAVGFGSCCCNEVTQLKAIVCASDSPKGTWSYMLCSWLFSQPAALSPR